MGLKDLFVRMTLKGYVRRTYDFLKKIETTCKIYEASTSDFLRVYLSITCIPVINRYLGLSLRQLTPNARAVALGSSDARRSMKAAAFL